MLSLIHSQSLFALQLGWVAADQKEEEEGTPVIMMTEDITGAGEAVIVEEQEVEIVEEAGVVGEETLVAVVDHQNCLVTTTGGD